jgi:hypothetical protein
MLSSTPVSRIGINGSIEVSTNFAELKTNEVLRRVPKVSYSLLLIIDMAVSKASSLQFLMSLAPNGLQTAA